ncbi:MAG TPA: hypothetical protein VNA69_05500 [Thermoanaerobaculia bacterium]|nr:hypothetical protein [Thermoanaerobaculia bacterium]
MPRLSRFLLAAPFLFAPALLAQTAESVPIYRWVATPCENWGCAIAALAAANGDPYVIVLPSKSTERPWVVLRRVLAGVMVYPQDDTYVVEYFSAIGEASARFASVDSARYPILVTTVDGGMIVICLRNPQQSPRRRAVAH